MARGREDVDKRGPWSPDPRLGEPEWGGGGKVIGEEDNCGTSGSGEEEREPG